MPHSFFAAVAALLVASPLAAQETGQATATLSDADGNQVGTVELAETPSGRTHVTVQAEDIPEGVHAVHVHETGDCGDGDFSAAGGHLAGDHTHGILTENGPHPGDLPNAHVQSDGVMAFEAFKTGLPLNEDMVFDDDGSAVIVHAGADDYESQPSGAAGDRIACGVIERSGD